MFLRTQFVFLDYDESPISFYIDYLAEMPGIISPDASEIAKAVSGDDFDLRKVRLFAEKYISTPRAHIRKTSYIYPANRQSTTEPKRDLTKRIWQHHWKS